MHKQGLNLENLHRIRSQLPSHVRLLAVTKKVDVEAMRAAYNEGIRDFAENRLQEALTKQEQLQDFPDISWHFIGHLQTNKAKKVLQHFTWIHSCDNLKLAQRLNRLAGELSINPKILLQVKILQDLNKYGWDQDALWNDLSVLNQCENLHIRGLMTILPLGLSESSILDTFEQTSALARKIEQQNWSNLKMQQLSMGMSGDYHLAVAAGATMVRLGRAIFGERPK